MSHDQHWRRLEMMYVAAPTNAYYKPKITIGDAIAEISIEARPDFHHAANAVHGAVYFKMLDDAGFFAVASLVEDVFVVTSDFTIHLFRPVSAGPMTAKGRVISRGKRIFVAEADLFDASGEILAHGVGSYVKSRITLDSLA